MPDKETPVSDVDKASRRDDTWSGWPSQRCHIMIVKHTFGGVAKRFVRNTKILCVEFLTLRILVE